MNHPLLKRWLVPLAAVALACLPARAAIDVSQWEHVAPITVDRPDGDRGGVAEVSLSPEILDRALPSLADIIFA